MAYTPTNWSCSDIVTADKINKIEQGIKDVHDGLFVVVTDTGTIDTISAHARMTYNINLATEYNIPTDGSYIPVGFLKIYPAFDKDKITLQGFDFYTDNSGAIKANINVRNEGDTAYTNVSMQVKMLLWKKS